MSVSNVMYTVYMTSEKFKEIRKEILTKKGRYYGYPECCIESYIVAYNQITYNNPLPITKEQEGVHLSTGFIPCQQHALKILSGKIHLEDLILPSREHPDPFKVYREKPKSRMTK